MKHTKKYNVSRQLYNAGSCLCKDRAEFKYSLGAQSNSSMGKSKDSYDNEYTVRLLEKTLDNYNLNLAYKRAAVKKGSHRIDGTSTDKLLPYIKNNEAQIKQFMLQWAYRLSLVRRAAIIEPDSRKRLLGITTVLDRLIH